MKITFIGGGSAKFVAGLTRDLFMFDALRDIEICLMDIQPDRMVRSEKLIQRMIGELKISAKVSCTSDQRQAVSGADFVILTIMVGGFKHYESDGSIPVKYGVLPTVGDTIGPGAVMRMIRTAPVLEELARNVRETAPKAWILNYTNPMAMVTWLLLHHGCLQTVGLCHSIQHEYRNLARWLGIQPEEVQYTAGGINHIDFYLTLTHRGESLYPKLLARKEELIKAHPDSRVKFELLESLGGWPAEGPQHQTEYYPWFRKNATMGEQDYACQTMWGYHFDQKINKELGQIVDEQIAGTRPIKYQKSVEYGANIVNSMRTGENGLIYGNVRNHGLIENLPRQAVVETPCHVDVNGVQPCRVGMVPWPLAAVMMPHIMGHQMTVDAVLEKNRTKAVQAMQSDALTGAILTLPQIKAMAEELFAANADYMQDWR